MGKSLAHGHRVSTTGRYRTPDHIEIETGAAVAGGALSVTDDFELLFQPSTGGVTPVGTVGHIQVVGAGATLDNTANPVTIDTSGNVVTTAAATTGESRPAAVVPRAPGASDTVLGATDPSAESKLFKMILRENTLTLNTGLPFFQSPAFYQYNSGGISGTGYGFPSGLEEMMWNHGMSQAMGLNAILGEIPQRSTLAPGRTTNVSFGFFDAASGFDKVIYDPLNLRAKGTGASASGTEFQAFGFNGNSIKTPGVFRIEVQARGDFAATHHGVHQLNVLSISVERYSAIGALLGTYTVGDILALQSGGRSMKGSVAHWVRAYDATDPTGQWGPLEHHRIVVTNNATVDATDIFVEAAVTWWPNP